MFSQVRYRCEHKLNYGTGTVLYCTELRPLSCLYEYLYDCTAVVPYFTSIIILRARTSTSRGTVQLRSVRVFPQLRYCCAHLLNYYGTGTVPQCTVLRPLSCLYLYSYEYATVLYCTVRVPYCISNNIPRARTSSRYRYSFCLPNLVNSAGTVLVPYRTGVPYSSEYRRTVPHIEILQYAYCSWLLQHLYLDQHDTRTVSYYYTHTTYTQPVAKRVYKDHTTASAPLESARHAS